jgi:hypothetical protein
MLVLLILIGLLIIPSICFAHSGTVMNSALNYLSFIFPFLSGILYSCRNFFKRVFLRKKPYKAYDKN